MNQYKFESGLPAQSGFNIRRFVIIIAVLLLVCYGLFNARSLLLGPSIEIFSPVAAETETRENIIIVKGKVTNMTHLSLSGRPIFVDTDSVFEEKLLLSPGFNIIEIKAKDRFGKETIKVIKVYLEQGGAAPAQANSSETDQTLLIN